MLSSRKNNNISWVLVLLFMLVSYLAAGQSTDNKSQYNQKLNEAEKLYFEKNYPAAKKAFKAALAINPSEKHPESRILEINKILGIQEDLSGGFAQLVAEQKNGQAMANKLSCVVSKPVLKILVECMLLRGF